MTGDSEVQRYNRHVIKRHHKEPVANALFGYRHQRRLEKEANAEASAPEAGTSKPSRAGGDPASAGAGVAPELLAVL